MFPYVKKSVSLRVVTRRALSAVSLSTLIGAILLPVSVQAKSLDQDLLSLTNETRKQRGLKSLRRHASLDKAAQLKAKDMLKFQYTYHPTRSGESFRAWLGKDSALFNKMGENLSTGRNLAPSIISTWMNSSIHRDNLLSKTYDRVGIAVVKGAYKGKKTTISVQIFGQYKKLTKKTVPGPSVTYEVKASRSAAKPSGPSSG